ncbi:hypothetical protein DFH09DRAFT_1169121 [Mycena vulgaris]|nr:hypothetical protein DFH09DRAFT_1169121 [Mycena vulgaris]
MSLDITLGALLVGTWANSILYTVEVIQAAYYYRHFKHDNWMLKSLVASAIAIDSVSMIANYASVYLYTTIHWGNLAYLQNQYWPLPLYILATGIVAALSQGFLVARYWLLSVRLELTCECRTWLVTEAVTEISIALALLLEFRKVKSSFKETRSLFNRLVAQTIQTGASGATIALAILIAFLANNESNGEFLGLPLSIPGSYISVPTGIAYCLGRVYCLTMLANLNVRQTGNTRSIIGTSSGANPGTRGEHRNQAQSESGDDKGGIRLWYSNFQVHIDPPQKVFSMGSFKTKPGQGLPDDSPAVEIEMTVNDSASYSSKKKQDLFAA